MTSHDVVAILRRVLGIKRVGHTGTLDPMATGVLPISVGTATRVMEYLDGDIKEYVCKLKLGLFTDTLDVWGKVLEEIPKEEVLKFMPDHIQIDEILKSFKGVIEQIPPIYSAIKVDGKRLYNYARADETVEIPKRKVYIENIEVLDLDFKEGEITLLIRCSKGTYIRSLCRDIAGKLGTIGTMSYLRRTKSGSFTEEDSIPIREVMAMEREEAIKLLVPMDKALDNLGKISIEDCKVDSFLNGGKIGRRDYKEESSPRYKDGEFPLPLGNHMNSYRVYGNYDNKLQLLGIGVIDSEKYFLKGQKILITRN